MKTLTVEEAQASLGRLVEAALAGEQIQIRQGDALVELRPKEASKLAGSNEKTPRKALERLQSESKLTPEQAEQYLREVRDERRAV